jgi:hypothetical protein
VHLNRPIVGMASTPDGGGYWLVASDGGIFTYGDARFYGSAGAIRLNTPIVGMASTPDGGGYWLVASDGGIFTYGDARFYGSTGAIHLNQPIVGMAPGPGGAGYWLVASDGGIFNYGTAAFHGSAGAIHLNKPIVAMVPTFTGQGYWLVASDGGIFNYGDGLFLGSAGGVALHSPIVGAAASAALGAGPTPIPGSPTPTRTPTPTAPPVVAGLSPTAGSITGGTQVTIAGSNLAGAIGVSFGGIAAAITYDSSTGMIVTSPPEQAGTVDVAVTTSGGTSALSTADRYTYSPNPPAVSGVSPAGGLTTGGTSVSISGANLAGATAVDFGSVAASITSDSGTQIVATAPAQAAGTVDVTVTTAQGTSATSAVDKFTYTIPPPTVSSVTPATASTAGNTFVTIDGTGFSAASAVTFGTQAATAFTIVSPTQILATSPAGSAGPPVDITVTNAGGTSQTNSGDHFTYSLTAPATITPVGSIVQQNNQPSVSTTSMPLTVTQGDLLALAIEEKYPTSTAHPFAVTNISGGNVTTWQKALSFTPSDGFHGVELWYGTVAASGSSAITVNTSADALNVGDPNSALSLDLQEFTASSNPATVWGLDTSAHMDIGPTTSTPDYPSLTPSSTAEVYFGYLAVTGVAAGGTTLGCVYQDDQRSNQIVYQRSVSTTIQPVATSDSGTSFSIGMLLTASP